MRRGFKNLQLPENLHRLPNRDPPPQDGGHACERMGLQQVRRQAVRRGRGSNQGGGAMNDDDAKVLSCINTARQFLFDEGHLWLADGIKKGLDLIERLMPRPMTLEEAPEALNAISFLYADDWEAITRDGGGGHLYSARGDCQLPLWAAVAVIRAPEAKKEA
jgi:hypothetical protein